MSYNVYVANLFGSLEGGRDTSDNSDLGSSVELCLSSDLSDELGVRGRDLGILLPDTSGNCPLSTLVGRLPSLQLIQTWKMNTDLYLEINVSTSIRLSSTLSYCQQTTIGFDWCPSHQVDHHAEPGLH